nr:protocadherin cluster 1 gamma 9a [Danio rerio]
MFVIRAFMRIICYLVRGQPLHPAYPWRVLFIMAVFSILKTNAQIRYSVPEEMKKGSLIGNIAHDLGLDVQRLRSGRARIVSGDSTDKSHLILTGDFPQTRGLDPAANTGSTPCSRDGLHTRSPGLEHVLKRQVPVLV